MPFVVPFLAAVIAPISAVVSAGVGAIAGAIGFSSIGASFAVSSFFSSLAGLSGFSAFVSTWSTVSLLASTALSRPPRVGISDTGGTQVSFQANPNAAVPILFGRTGTAGIAIHQTTDGQAQKNAHLMRPVVLSFGPVNAIESFKAGDITVTFTGEIASSGLAADGGADNRYNGKMAMRYQLGAKPSPEFLVPWVPLHVPEWTSAHKLSGYAAAWWGLEFDSAGKTYPTGTPPPMWTVDGRPVYDPRLDSTYPGGSGACRPDDDATWVFTGNDNPFLVGLTWCLGHYANGKKILGLGLPLAKIDVAAFIEGANVCEANGWTMGGVAYSSDRKWDVLRACLQAGSGEPMRLGGRVSCFVNTPRVSLATVTGDDIVGEASVTGTQARRNRFNTIIPRFRSEVHGWDLVPGGPVAVATYITEDGGSRTREVEYPLTQDKDIAAQLAAYDIVNSREFGPIILPTKPKYMGYKGGDCLTVDEPELGLNSQKVVILSRDVDPSTGIVTLTCRSETDAKHDFALGKTGTAPPTPSLTGIDLSVMAAPESGTFTLVGVTLEGPVASFPAIQISGTIDNPNAASVVVRYRVDGATDWQAWPKIAASDALLTIDISSVAAGETYEAEISYVSTRGVQSDWTALGTAIAGDFTFAEFQAQLYANPAKNLYRKADWVPADGAVFRDRTPLGLGVANGASGWGYRFPAATDGARISVPGKVNGLISNGDRYAAQFVAFLSAGSGTAQIRAGWRDISGNPISDLADEIYTVTTTPQRFVWAGFGSNDPDFTTAAFRVFELTGDIAGGQSVDVTDLQMEYGGGASSGWRPSPDDPDALAYVGYIGALDATRNSIWVQTGDPGGAAANGDFWVDISTTPYVLKTRVAGAWQVSAANGGAFGNNLYHTPGGTLATLSNFLTSGGVAAAIAGQGPLATASNPVATLQYLDGNGQFSDWRGLGNPNGAAGMAAVFDVNPLSTDTRYCNIAAFNLKGEGYTRACSSGVLDFGGADVTFGVVMRWSDGVYGFIYVDDIDLYIAAGGWLYLGTCKTQVSAGVYSAPPIAPDGYLPDFGGVHGGVQIF